MLHNCTGIAQKRAAYRAIDASKQNDDEDVVVDLGVTLRANDERVDGTRVCQSQLDEAQRFGGGDNKQQQFLPLSTKRLC